MQKLILATRNKGKIKELQGLFAGMPVEIHSLLDFDIPEIEEDGITFQDNALKKAQTVYDATGIPAVADDSGLEIDYLSGLPGVHSARFAGTHGDDAANTSKVLLMLMDVPIGKRTARFKSVIAVCGIKQQPIITTGTCEGFIANAPQGENGFGYDPVFWVPDYEKTMAELSLEEKNVISHRAVAFRKVYKELEKALAWG